MSALISGGSKQQKPIIYSRVQISSSLLGIPVPIFWGQRRLATNCVWANDFKKHSISPKGKGSLTKGDTQEYDYTAAVILALCEGPIDAIVNVWPSGSTTTTTTLSKLNMTLFSGTALQTPWSYVTTNYPDEARSYPLTAYLACPKLDLGPSATIPDNAFECTRALSFYTQTSDGWIDPATGDPTSAIDVKLSDCLYDLLTSTQYGFEWSSADIGDLSQFDTYQQAQGLFFSPLLNSTEKCTDILDRWAQLSNAWIYWDGSQLQAVPLGDQAITANGVTYTPDIAPAYDLDLDDFVGDQPVTVTRKDPADCYNRCIVNLTDRTLGYISNPVEYRDQTLTDQFGTRDDNQVQADEICDPNVGLIVAQLIGKRAAYIRNTYRFKTSYRRIRLIPGSIATLTEPNIGITKMPVRITSVSEDEDGALSFEAEEFPGSIGRFVSKGAPTPGVPTTPNQNADPGNVNTPAIIEPGASFTGGGQPKILIAASGGADWGGAKVYISFDGTNYESIGSIVSPPPQGVLTADLADHSDPDSTNTLSVDCTESLTAPQAVTHDDADAFRTLTLVAAQPTLSGGAYIVPTDGELLAFGDVSATGSYTADLTYLRRGLYGTAHAAHSTGDQFTVLDPLGESGTTLAYSLPPQYIGKTIYVKFASFNPFGNALQDISTVDEFQYTPSGVGYGTGTGGVPQTPTGLTATGGTAQVVLTWNANPSGDNVTSYAIYRANGTGASFGSASQIASVGTATSYLDTGLTAGADYTYFVKAVNAVGASDPTAGADATVGSAVVLALRVSGGTPGRAPKSSEELYNPPMKTGDKLASGLPGSLLVCETAPTADWTMTLYKNGSSIGTGTILASATTGSFTFSSDVTFTDGDIFKAICPSSADLTIKGVGYTIIGTRAN